MIVASRSRALTRTPRYLATASIRSPGLRNFHPIRRVTVFVRFLTCSVVAAKLMHLISFYLILSVFPCDHDNRYTGQKECHNNILGVNLNRSPNILHILSPLFTSSRTSKSRTGPATCPGSRRCYRREISLSPCSSPDRSGTIVAWLG